MSNLTNNRVNTVISAADATALRAAFTTINTILAPYIHSLTVEERQRLPKIQSNNKTFTEDAITGAQANPQYLPAYFPVADMLTDLTYHNQLDEFVLLAETLWENLRDTQILAGSEAYSAGLIFYGLVKAAAKAGQPGADTIYNMLKERFSGQGGGEEEPENPPTP